MNAKLILDNQTYFLVHEKYHEAFMDWLDAQEAAEAYREFVQSGEKAIPMSDFLNENGNNIAKIRKAKGMSQKTLAGILGTTQSHLSRWESGDVAPSTKYVNALMKALNCKLDELFIFQVEKI